MPGESLGEVELEEEYNESTSQPQLLAVNREQLIDAGWEPENVYHTIAYDVEIKLDEAIDVFHTETRTKPRERYYANLKLSYDGEKFETSLNDKK